MDIRQWRWAFYVGIVVSTIADSLLTNRYGWWPVGALFAAIPSVLIAMVVVGTSKRASSTRRRG